MLVAALLALLIFTKNAVNKKVASKEALRTESLSHTDISEDVVAYQEPGKKFGEVLKPLRIKTSK